MDLNPEFEKYSELVYENLKKCTDIDFTIVKGHILIEHHINRFILASIKNQIFFKDNAFTFSQKLKLSLMLGFVDIIEEDLILINKLRNEIAHKLTYSEGLLDTLLSRTEKRWSKERHLKDISKMEALKACIGFICGALYAAVGINHPEFLKILDKELENNTIANEHAASMRGKSVRKPIGSNENENETRK